MPTAIIFIFLLISSQVFGKASPFYIDNIQEIQKHMPSYSISDLEGLVFERKGDDPYSFMRTLGWHTSVSKNKTYLLSKDGLIPLNQNENHSLKNIKNIPIDFLPKEITKPQFISIKAKWKNSTTLTKKEEQGRDVLSNILGKNGRLYLKTNEEEITIPINTASPEKLAYYGAIALKIGDTVRFPPRDHDYPIWLMSLGENYTRDYIMSERAGGWYLEWHTDRPHFHMPLSEDASGFYILAKKTSASSYELSAFRIPYGTAVYTMHGGIHCDAGLVGNQWIVGYATSDHFSTVLLRNKSGEILDLKFK